MLHQLRVLCFAVAHPRRAAGREQRNVVPGCDMLDKLGGFLNYREVSSGGGVVDLVKSHSAEGSNDNSHGVCTVLQT